MRRIFKTRFAPSPTGFLHIGGVRTALFNYLFARHHDGQFVLRIDDTDGQRNQEAAIEPILHGLRWMGIKWDEGPIFQSDRKEIYRGYLEKLLLVGKAYEDDGAIRLKLANRNFVIRDFVRGVVTWDLAERQDPVICRKDGSYLYNFATVVDDYEMGITHVIRAEEHLSNTPVQLAIYEALGLEEPRFAHIPLVCAPNSRKKLSKRENYDNLLPKGYATNLNPVFLDFYEKMGYLPESVFNYLSLLGWSYDDKTEIMTPEEIVERFSIDRVLSNPASFDPNKIYHFASQHFNRLELSARVERIQQFYGEKYKDAVLIWRAIECCQDRIKLMSDFERLADFFFVEPTYEKIEAPEWASNLRRFVYFTSVVSKDAKLLEGNCRQLCVNNKIDFKDCVKQVRIAITGKTVGPRLFESMVVLGEDECKKRIENYSKAVAASQKVATLV